MSDKRGAVGLTLPSIEADSSGHYGGIAPTVEELEIRSQIKSVIRAISMLRKISPASMIAQLVPTIVELVVETAKPNKNDIISAVVFYKNLVAAFVALIETPSGRALIDDALADNSPAPKVKSESGLEWS